MSRPAATELERVKGAAHDCLLDGEYLKALIIPVTDRASPFCGQFHVLTHGGGRDVFTTHEAACKWASAYFLVASVMKRVECRSCGSGAVNPVDGECPSCVELR